MNALIVCLSAVVLTGLCLRETWETNASNGNMLHKSGEGFTLFLNTTDTSFYFLQARTSISVPAKGNYAGFNNNILTIQDLATAKPVNYRLDANIYGITVLKGQKFTQLLTSSTPGEMSIRTDIDDYVDDLACRCLPDKQTLHEECKQGGGGVTDCEITDGGSTGPMGWKYQCFVYCGEGYDACCIEEMTH